MRRVFVRSRGIAGALVLASRPRRSRSSAAGAFVLTATSPAGNYAPTFTGNGMLGVRVPPSGQGYAAGTVPAQSELAGFYAQVAGARSPRTTSSSARTSRPGRR